MMCQGHKAKLMPEEENCDNATLSLLLLSAPVVGKNSNEQGGKRKNPTQMHMFACQRAAECFCSVWNTSKGYQLCMFSDSSFCRLQPAWG